MVREVYEFPWEAQFDAATCTVMLGDMTRNNSQTLGRTLRFFEVRNPAGDIILVSGVALWGVTRPPELWMMMAKPFTNLLRESLYLTREGLRLPLSIYGRLVADVANDNAKELNFVKKLGFRPTGERSVRPGWEDVTQFELTA